MVIKKKHNIIGNILLLLFFDMFSILNCWSFFAPKKNPPTSLQSRTATAGEVADDVDIESLGFAHKYDITGARLERKARAKKFMKSLIFGMAHICLGWPIFLGDGFLIWLNLNDEQFANLNMASRNN